MRTAAKKVGVVAVRPPGVSSETATVKRGSGLLWAVLAAMVVVGLLYLVSAQTPDLRAVPHDLRARFLDWPPAS